MEAENTSKVSEAVPMQGGDGPNSYAKNSTYQRVLVNAGKELLKKAITEKLDIEMFLPSKSFHIADFGCSTGPNTFLAVQNILEAVEFKYQSRGLINSQVPDFFVYFNDHTSNDFNTLFKSLPQNKRYYAAGVPGSFYGQVFPKASIHFAYSSNSIHWLSQVPKAVTDSNSPAWNKGRIHYANSTDEVVRAYETQYNDDMESFLQARAQEIVHGGLMVLTFSGRSNGTPQSASPSFLIQLLESCLMDLVRKGVVSEAKVDSFNIPVYHMSPEELAAVVERNRRFSVEIVELLPTPSIIDSTTSVPQLLERHARAIMAGMLKQQFGEEILDELFHLYREKCEETILSIRSRMGIVSEDKIDSYNIPTYNMSSQELVAGVERNGFFNIERMVDVPLPVLRDAKLKAQVLASHFRASLEGDLKQQFGEEIIDELFDLYQDKCEEHAADLDPGKSANFLVVLRRKAEEVL